MSVQDRLNEAIGIICDLLETDYDTEEWDEVQLRASAFVGREVA